MALAGGATTVAACLFLALAVAAGAASPAPAPAVDCVAKATSLADCLDYVQPGSASSMPSKACCGEVKTAVNDPATVDCLCTVFASGGLPIPLNMTRVLGLPAACGASASAFSKCHIAPGPGAPTEAPAPSPSAGEPSSGSGIAAPPKAAAAASSPVTAAVLVAAAAAPLLAYYHL